MKPIHNLRFSALLLYMVPAAVFLFPLRAGSRDVRLTEARMMKQAEENIEKFRKGDVISQFSQTGL